MAQIKTGTTKSRVIFKYIITACLIAGTLDITAAFINSYIRNGTSPVIILQFIASGILGNDAFSGGTASAAAGLIFHYIIAGIWSAVFFFLYPRLKIKNGNNILIGIAYGLLVWLIMNLFVVPLSNTPSYSPSSMQIIIGILILMLCIGLPITIIYKKYERHVL